MDASRPMRTRLSTLRKLRSSRSCVKVWVLPAFIISILLNVLPGCCHHPEISEWFMMPNRAHWLILRLEAIGHVGFEATDNRFSVEFQRGRRPDVVVMNVYYFGYTDKQEDAAQYEGLVSTDVYSVLSRVRNAFHNCFAPSNNDFILVVRVHCLGGNKLSIERLDKQYYTGIGWDKKNVKEILKVGEEEFMQREVFDNAR